MTGHISSSTMKNFLLFLVLSVVSVSILAFETCPSDNADPSSEKSTHSSKSENSCKGRCGEKYNKKNNCHCNNKCSKFNNCCTDHSTLCGGASSNSHSNDAEPSSETFTHSSKSENSCQGRCGEKFNKKNHCHCNKKCGKFNNCCSDYSTLCGGASSNSHSNDASETYCHSGKSDGDISNEEINTISEKLYKLDINKAAESDIILNKQEMVEKNGPKQDLCEKPLYKYVNEKLFSRPTYAAYICLLDNYDRKTGTDESYSEAEIKEQDHFLHEIMKTELMKELYNFFHQKGIYQTEKEFVKDLQNMWFGLYTRSSGEADSSGFEHVFVGEVKKGKVSGFHSWIRFYLLEKKGLVDYYSHNFDGPWTSYPDVLGKQFHWDGFMKEVGSQFIGSSPEFDFAVYSLCFITRPGRICKVSLGGHSLSIQTYTWTQTSYGNGKKFIATAYPVC
ncbi:uridylate-specific endoribonuclease isoform X2 [Ascaphus truei]|uniref:uridylate-specific endoribonuclease isoform X2 n=1 Tax=Ascaphus truei TaxID=8439 RepID=UPI003F59F4B3